MDPAGGAWASRRQETGRLKAKVDNRPPGLPQGRRTEATRCVDDRPDDERGEASQGTTGLPPGKPRDLSDGSAQGNPAPNPPPPRGDVTAWRGTDRGGREGVRRSGRGPLGRGHRKTQTEQSMGALRRRYNFAPISARGQDWTVRVGVTTSARSTAVGWRCEAR